MTALPRWPTSRLGRPSPAAADPLRARPGRPRASMVPRAAVPAGRLQAGLPGGLRRCPAAPRDGLRGIPAASAGRRATLARRVPPSLRIDRTGLARGDGTLTPGRAGRGQPEWRKCPQVAGSAPRIPPGRRRAGRAHPHAGPDRSPCGGAARRGHEPPAAGRHRLPRVPPVLGAGPGCLRPRLPGAARRPGRPARGPQGLGRRRGRDARAGPAPAYQHRAHLLGPPPRAAAGRLHALPRRDHAGGYPGRAAPAGEAAGLGRGPAEHPPQPQGSRPGALRRTMDRRRRRAGSLGPPTCRPRPRRWPRRPTACDPSDTSRRCSG